MRLQLGEYAKRFRNDEVLQRKLRGECDDDGQDGLDGGRDGIGVDSGSRCARARDCGARQVLEGVSAVSISLGSEID